MPDIDFSGDYTDTSPGSTVFGDTADSGSLLKSLDSFSLTSLLGGDNQSSVHPPVVNTGAPSLPSQQNDHNALVQSLALDATKVATAAFGAQAAAKIATSPNSKYVVYGGVAIAAIVLIYLLVK